MVKTRAAISAGNFDSFESLQNKMEIGKWSWHRELRCRQNRQVRVSSSYFSFGSAKVQNGVSQTGHEERWALHEELRRHASGGLAKLAGDIFHGLVETSKDRVIVAALGGEAK